MSKLSVAMRLADETGVSLSKAQKFIDDVGLDAARKAADDAAELGSKTLSSGWWKPTAGGVLVGGGALAWRQQELEQAKAIASQQQSYSGALAAVMDSDLSPKAKRELADSLVNNSPASSDGSGGSGGSGGNGGGSLLGGDMQTTIILVIVMVFVLKFALDGGDD